MDKKRVIFMGTPAIAAAILDALAAMDVDIVLAVTQPDKQKGRKRHVEFSPVKQKALELNIPVFQPVQIKNDYEPIVAADADLIVTCAYGQIVPQAVLDAGKMGCVNLHGSLLPAYRGGAPIQRAIWDGLKESGMSLMEMVPKMDAGGVMDQDVFVIEPQDNSSTVFAKMADSAVRLLEKNLAALLAGEGHFEPQAEELVTFAPIITKEEEHLDLSAADERICNQIRALAMEPGAYVNVKNKKLKILQASYSPDLKGELGQLQAIGKKQLALGLHEGSLMLELVQPESKPVMKTADFMNGQGRSLSGEFVS